MKAFLYVILPALVAGFGFGAVWYPLVDALDYHHYPTWILPWTALILGGILGYQLLYKPARQREFGPNASY
jgi:hypothetical protein